MSAKPLTREERAGITGRWADPINHRWEATVQAADERAERLRAGLLAVAVGRHHTAQTSFERFNAARAALAADDEGRR